MEDLIIIYFCMQHRCTIGITQDGTVKTYSLTPLQLFQDWCSRSGSSLEGRIECYKRRMNVVQKPAIMVRSNPPALFFPTLSMRREDCLFLRYDQIQRIAPDGTDSCIVHFHSGVRYRVTADARILRRQKNHCRRYLNLLSVQS